MTYTRVYAIILKIYAFCRQKDDIFRREFDKIHEDYFNNSRQLFTRVLQLDGLTG